MEPDEDAAAQAIMRVMLADYVGQIEGKEPGYFPDDVWPRLNQSSRDKYLEAARAAIAIISA